MRTQEEIIAQVKEWASTSDERLWSRALVATLFLTHESAKRVQEILYMPDEVLDQWPDYHKVNIAEALDTILNELSEETSAADLWVSINTLHALIWLSGSDQNIGGMTVSAGLQFAKQVSESLRHEPYKIDVGYKIIHS